MGRKKKNTTSFKTSRTAEKKLEEDQVIHRPDSRSLYRIERCIGEADLGLTKVYQAVYVEDPTSTDETQREQKRVAVKVSFLTRSELSVELRKIFKEKIKTSFRVHNAQANVLGYNEHFSCEDLYVTSLPLSMGSIRYMLSKRFKNGLPENLIATVLKETLKGLLFIHTQRDHHGQLDASQIFVLKNPTCIKLAFEVTMYNHNPIEPPSWFEKFLKLIFKDYFLGRATPPDPEFEAFWPTPGLREGPEASLSNSGICSPQASDIWWVGITALELAFGSLIAKTDHQLYELAKCTVEDMEVAEDQEGAEGKIPMGMGKKIWLSITGKMQSWGDKIHGVSHRKPRLFSSRFKNFLQLCLEDNPADRPTVDQLLSHPFFESNTTMQMRAVGKILGEGYKTVQ